MNLRTERLFVAAALAAFLVPAAPVDARPASDPPVVAVPSSAPGGREDAAANDDLPDLSLPVGTGDAPVGAQTLWLVDHDRRDPWEPQAGPRQVKVTMLFPARGSGGRPLPYTNAAESKAYLDFQREQDPSLADLPRELFTVVRTRARLGVATRPHRHPLVLLSPGLSLPGWTLTSQATELASRGYLVAILDHPYESSGTTLANGTLASCVACESDDYAKVPRVRRADVDLVLDRLLAPGSAWQRLIDPRRIGMAGHSIGGNSAAVADRRVRAVADLDGTLFAPVRNRHRPLLLLGTEAHNPGGEDESWDRTWRRHRGPGAWVTLDGSNHSTSTDLPALAQQAGFPTQPGSISGARGLRIERAVVGAFFDRFLRGREVGLPAFSELHRAKGGF